MKYLITGGAGFLGINLVRYLHSKGHEITSLDIVPFDYRDMNCLLYTSDAADERSSVDLGGRRIIKKKKQEYNAGDTRTKENKTIPPIHTGSYSLRAKPDTY